MLDKSFGLNFYLKKAKNHKKGPIPIYLRITVDGGRSEVSTKRAVDFNRWNTSSQKVNGTKEDARSLNAYLDSLLMKAFEAKRHLIEATKMITAEAIKDTLVGSHERDKMLISIFKEYNNDVRKLIGRDYSVSTWKKYERTQRLVQLFIQSKYGQVDLNIHQLNLEFVTSLDLWFKTERKCSQNTTVKYISILKMIVLHCVNNDWLLKDPFAKYKMRKEEVVPEYLSKDELTRLIEKQIFIERLRQIRDVFVFCCYTGLSYIDIKKLNKEEVAKGVDDNLWIFTKRGKTNTPSKIPLLPIAKKILLIYEDNPYCITKGKLLPVLSNQKYNSYLKELADICGINKNLTSHTARHTFATTVTLENGVPLETVSKMLGHKKLLTTQHYARVLDNKVSKDMKVLQETLN